MKITWSLLDRMSQSRTNPTLLHQILFLSKKIYTGFVSMSLISLGTIQVLRLQGGRWGKKMAIFADLQYYLFWRGWVGLKKPKTWWRNTWMFLNQLSLINVHKKTFLIDPNRLEIDFLQQWNRRATMKYSLQIITQIIVITWISMVYTSTVVTSNNTDQSVLKSLIDYKNGANKIQASINIEDTTTQTEECPLINW